LKNAILFQDYHWEYSGILTQLFENNPKISKHDLRRINSVSILK